MTHPLSQHDLEQKIIDLIARLEEATETYAEKERALAMADSRYKKERAVAFLKADGAVRERESKADAEVKHYHRAYCLAQAEAKAQREILRSLTEALGGYRSLNSNVRNQV